MTRLKKWLVTTILLPAAIYTSAQGTYAFRDTTLSHHERIIDLLSRLTIPEKISLLRNNAPAISRLGVDKYYHGNEALHGVVRPGNFTVFPQAIGMAAMWNPELMHRISTAISDEARGKWNELNQGKDQHDWSSDLLSFWSPTINMARDPRWGRTPETYGEDPFLTGTLGKAFVRGLQGDHPKYLKVVSTPKHFAGNNEDNNRASCNAVISERDLREYYLVPFEMCIREAKAQSIMSAYNAVNGVPCSLNKWLLTDVLRKDWGFDGYVVSDCGALDYTVTYHHYVDTHEEAASQCLKAGLDLECGEVVYNTPLQNAYNRGMVSSAEIDTALYRLLRMRMRLGIFDDQAYNPYNHISPSVVGCKEHQELALEAARQSLVLLKNDNETLPLDIDQINSIAVVGPNAAKCVFGDYSGTPANPPVSILEGIKSYVGDQVTVNAAPWVSPSMEYTLIGSSAFRNGLQVEYYNNINLSGTPNTRTEEYVLYDPKNTPPDPLVPSSPMSIRWTGELTAPATGEYTFAFTSDDGCRLYIDNQLVIEDWGIRPAVTNYATVTLTEGQVYTLKAEYFDNGGEAIAQLDWKTPTANVLKYTLMDKSVFPDGLRAEYYAKTEPSGRPKARRTVETLYYDPKNQDLDSAIPGSPMSIRWTGDFIAPSTGRYTFAFTSDDGCRLYIDDRILIDSWYVRAATTDYASISLVAGQRYTLKAEYFDQSGEAIAKLEWRTPDETGELLGAYGSAGDVIRASDVTIAVLGIDLSIEREGKDRSTIELPEDQQLFIEEAYKANPNTIVVLVAGSSLAINWMDENIPAILDSWYSGEQGGNAVAQALFGDYNPGGRLPLTFYNNLGEVPAFNDYDIKNRRTYMYFDGTPLYPFGYGLSYTKFDYRGLDLSQDEDTVTVTFQVSNSGEYDGDEVSQVYIQFPSQSGITPLKQLKGFKRVRIAKGEEREIAIEIPKKELRLWSESQSAFYTPEGTYVFLVGASSEDIRLQKSIFIEGTSGIATTPFIGVQAFSRDSRIVVNARQVIDFEIYTVDGKQLHSQKRFFGEQEFTVTAGSYLVKTIDTDRKESVFKVIVH